MTPSWLIIAAIFLPLSTLGLQCYTGFSPFKGISAGTTPTTCAAGESCLFYSAEINDLFKLKHATCSKNRCTLLGGPNSCGNFTYQGREFKGCCCDTGDFCQGPKDKKGFLERAKGGIGGWIKKFTGIGR